MRYDIVIIGGGYSGTRLAECLQRAGRKVGILSSGASLYVTSRKACEQVGVDFFDACRAVTAEWQGNRVLSVRCANDVVVKADVFVLATGKYLSRGLLSDQTHIWEPVFGLDVAYDNDVTRWWDEDVFVAQPFERFGVRHQQGRVYRMGVECANVYAVGEVLAGAMLKDNQIDEVCNRLC